MTLNPTKIQPAIWKRLASIVHKGKVGSAYLFSGPEGSGKEAAALEFAAMLNCNSKGDAPCGSCASCIRFRSLQDEKLTLMFPLPGSEKKDSSASDPLKGLSKDEAAILVSAIEAKAKDPFFRIRVPRARQILISQIRELRRTVYLKSTSDGRKCVMFFQAHTLGKGIAASANALLKILEEPPPNTTFILITDYPSQLPLTVVSRCQHITFPPLENESIVSLLTSKGIETRTANLCVHISGGNLHRALSLSDQSPNELLSYTKDFVSTLLTEDGGRWKTLSQEFGRMARFSPEESRMRIALVQKWFHEAYLIRSGANNGNSFADFSEDISSFNQRYPNADLKEIHSALDRIVQAPDKNLYMPLVMTNMFLDVRRHLAGSN